MADRTYADELIEEARGQRRAVVAKVRQLGGVRAALPILMGLAQRAPFSDVRIAVVDALGHFHSDDAEEALISILRQDKDWHVRNAALKNLAQLATPRAIAALEQATKDRAYGVREDARLLLAQAKERRRR